MNYSSLGWYASLFSLCSDFLLSQVVLEHRGLPGCWTNEAELTDWVSQRKATPVLLKGLAVPSFHPFRPLPPFFLPNMDLAGFHQRVRVEYFILLSCPKFYLQVSKRYNMKSMEEKGSKIIVNFGKIGGHSLTNESGHLLTNVF